MDDDKNMTTEWRFETVLQQALQKKTEDSRTKLFEQLGEKVTTVGAIICNGRNKITFNLGLGLHARSHLVEFQ